MGCPACGPNGYLASGSITSPSTTSCFDWKCRPRRSQSRSGRSPLPRASPHEAGPWSEEKASPCRSCRTGPHPGAAGPGGAGPLCRHVRPNTTRHLFPRSPVDLTGGAPTFWSLQRRCLRSWRRVVGRRRADSGCSLAGPHVCARACPDHRRLENRCHHRDVVDTGTKPGADTCLDRADLTQFLYSVPMRNRVDLFMCS
jgi:hypothetical protein